MQWKIKFQIYDSKIHILILCFTLIEFITRFLSLDIKKFRINMRTQTKWLHEFNTRKLMWKCSHYFLWFWPRGNNESCHQS